MTCQLTIQTVQILHIPTSSDFIWCWGDLDGGHSESISRGARPAVWPQLGRLAMPAEHSIVIASIYIYIIHVTPCFCLTISFMLWSDLALTTWTCHKTIALFRAIAYSRPIHSPCLYGTSHAEADNWYPSAGTLFIFSYYIAWIMNAMILIDLVYFMRSHNVPIQFVPRSLLALRWTAIIETIHPVHGVALAKAALVGKTAQKRSKSTQQQRVWPSGRARRSEHSILESCQCFCSERCWWYLMIMRHLANVCTFRIRYSEHGRTHTGTLGTTASDYTVW